jgi:Uma2 family endonuclease
MAAEPRLTLAQFLALPDTKGLEYVCGEIWEKPMGTRAHSMVQHLLSVAFFLFLRDHPIGEAGPEWSCVFGPPGRRRGWLPDFAFIAKERVAADPLDAPHEGPPDLAVEVLSPDDRPGRVSEKIAFYLTYGVRLVWLVDTRERTVRVFAPGQEPLTLAEADTLDGGDVLPDFAVRVSEILPPVQERT